MSELLNLVRHTLDEKLAENIVTIDIRNVNAYTDYYVICTAKNPRHANSLVEFVEKEVTKNGFDVRLRYFFFNEFHKRICVSRILCSTDDIIVCICIDIAYIDCNDILCQFFI